MSAPALAPAAPLRQRRPDPSVSQAAGVGTVAFVVSVALSFVITPFLVRTLGDARYGTWSLIAQVTGYYGLLDFGVRGAVAYYAASLLASEKDEEVSDLASSAFWGLAAIAVVVVALGGLLMVFFPSWFETAGVADGEIRGAIAIVTMSLALTLPFDVFGAIVNGCRRPDILHGVDMAVRIVTSGLLVLVLSRGGGLMGLAAVQLSGRLVNWAVLYAVSRHYVPSLTLSPWRFGREWLRKVVNYGSRNFVINVSLAVMYRVDYILIGSFLGVRFVTAYSIGRMMTGYVSSACLNVTRSFTMHFAHHAAREEHEQLRDLYLKGIRLSATIAGLLAGYVLVFGKPFLRLWLGPSYVEGPWGERTDVILGILIVGQAPALMQNLSRQFLFGTSRVTYMMRVQVGEAIAKVILSLLLVAPLGLPGVALGTLIPLVVTNTLVMPPYVLRELGLSGRVYLGQGIGRPAILTVLVTAISAVLVANVAITGWLPFLTLAALAATVGAILAYAGVLTADERRWMWRRLMLLRST